MKETDFTVIDLVITKAGAVAGNAPNDLLIEFSGKPPELEALKEKDWRDKYDAFYNEQAAALGKALINTLPGGTLDRLIVFLLTQKASYFRVPYVEPHEEARIGDLIEAIRPFIEIAKKTDDLEDNCKIGGISVSTVRKLREVINKFLK